MSRPTPPTAAGCFPVIQSILAPAELLEYILRTYAIAAPATCSLLHHGGRNDTYVVRTTAGSYIVRVYGARWRSAAEVAYEVALLRHLAGKGVSVAAPVADRRGAWQSGLPAPEGERQLVLFTRASGRALSWTEQHSYQAGQLMARIHAATDDFVSPHPRAQLDLDYLINAPLAVVAPFLEHRPADWGDLQALAERLRMRAETAIQDGLDWGVCHGDFSSGNIHVADDATLTIFDFDFCGPGWRICDFVDVQRKAQAAKQTGLWDCFARGYSETRLVAPVNFAAVGLFVAIGHLRGLGHHAWSSSFHGLERMADWYLDWELKALREWATAPAGGW